MSVIGIVAEYNPFHEGHRYQLEQAKSLAGADGVVVAMSGDFVQRGEPALLSKWERAEAAVNAGADLVFEIPLRGTLADAGTFGEAGVRTLLATNLVTHLSFGSEAGELSILFHAAKRLERGDFRQALRDAQQEGLSYPAAQEAAYRKLYGDASEEELLVMKSPNDLLALSYLRALLRYAKEAGLSELPLVPLPIPRKGAHYHEHSLRKTFASASGIRNALNEGRPAEEWSHFVPEGETSALLRIEPKLREAEERYFLMIQGLLLTMDEKEVGARLDRYPAGGEGIGNRLRREVLHAENTEDLIKRSKSGRYTYTRIARLLAQTVLDLPREENPDDAANGAEPAYLKLLAASAHGRRMLRERKETDASVIPVLTNENRQEQLLSEKGRRQREESVRASNLRNLLYREDLYLSSDYVRHPYLEEEERNRH